MCRRLIFLSHYNYLCDKNKLASEVMLQQSYDLAQAY